MDVLEKLLFDLQASTDGTSSILSSQDIAENIVHHCSYNLTLSGTELEYTLFFLTQSESPPNVIEFLALRTKDKDIVKAKVVLLKFLALLIKQIGAAVDSSSGVIFVACVNVFKKDESNEVKAASLLPVKNLLRLATVADFHFTEQQVQLESLFTLLISQYLSKKSTGGIRYVVLVTLGHLVKEFPYAEATLARVGQVADIVMNVLNSNFGSKSKSAPDLSTLAGAFSCLDRCLFEFEDRFTSDSSQTADLWKYLMMALSGMNNDSLFRFAVVGKALRLIKHHSFLFQSMIVLNMAASYRLALVCYFSDREVCKKHANEALVAILSEFSTAILANTLHPSDDEKSFAMYENAHQVLADIVSQFLNYLGNDTDPDQRQGTDLSSSTIATASAEGSGKSSARKISLGVKGITAIAPALTALYRARTNTRNRIIQTLMRSCDNLLLQMAVKKAHRGNEGMINGPTTLVLQYDTEAILRKSQFLSAIAITMHSLLCAVQCSEGSGEMVVDLGGDEHLSTTTTTPSISDALLNFLLSSGADITLAYSRLWGVGTPSAARSSLCVFFRAVAFSFPVQCGDEREIRNLACPTAAVSCVLEEVLDTVIPLLLMRTMSRAEMGELSEVHSFDPITGDADQRLHSAYIPLWKELFSPIDAETTRMLRLMADGSILVHQQETDPFCFGYEQVVFPSLLKTFLAEVFKILQAFDLSYILPALLSTGGEEIEFGENEKENASEDPITYSLSSLLPLPNNSADHELLLNLVSFLETLESVLLPQFQVLHRSSIVLHSQVCEWVAMLLGETVALCRAWPMVSGLYRLCSVFTSLDSALQKPCGRKTTDGELPEQIITEGLESSGNSSLLITFYQETTQYIIHTFHHPELISSALKMIFSAPVALVTLDTLVKSVYLPLLKHSLSSGVQLHLAFKIMFLYLDFDAERKYSKSQCLGAVPDVLSDDILQKLLPLLDKYLTGLSKSSSEIDGKHVSKSKFRKQNDGRGGNNYLSNSSYMVGGSEITELGFEGHGSDDVLVSDGDEDIKLTILRFLARLGGRNKYLLQNASSTISSSLEWDSFNHQLTVDIPVSSDFMSLGLSQNQSQRSVSQQNNKVPVNIGAVVPRLVELSIDSRPINRQLRLYAQECLHGVTLLMIGKAAQVTAADKTGEKYKAMFATLFPTIISLSVSDDGVTKQLFEKLLFQIIHWLSSTCSGNVLLCDIYSSLIDHLMDGTSGDLVVTPVTSASESSSSAGNGSIVIRDKCIVGVVECFRWTSKNSQVSNTDSPQGNVETISIDGIMARLLTLSTHPIESKRLGAVGVLNQLYIYVREDIHLIYKYGLRVMFVLLNAVKQPGRGSGQVTCALAVGHYMKIIVRVSQKDELDAAFIRQGRWKVQSGGSKKKASQQAIFSMDSDLQHESDHPTYPFTLRDLAAWLWHHVTHGDYTFRRQCMLCLSELCCLLPCPSHSLNKLVKSHSERPHHLQAIVNCLFGGVLISSSNVPPSAESILQQVSSDFVRPLSQSFRKGVVSRHQTHHKSSLGFSPLSYPFFLHASNPHANNSNTLLCEEEIMWLHALNGSLDAYNFLITCVDGCNGSDLFVLPGDSNSYGNSIDSIDTLEVKGLGKKKRGRATTTDGVTPVMGDSRTTMPVCTTGRLLFDSLLRFFACCFHRMGQRTEPLSSATESRVASQEQLLGEVIRRSFQLITSLLKRERSYFESYLTEVGLLVPSKGGQEGLEMAMFVQFVLLSSLFSIPSNFSNITSCYVPIADVCGRNSEWSQAQTIFAHCISNAPEVFSGALKTAEGEAKLCALSNRMEIDGSSADFMFMFPSTHRVGGTTGGGVMGQNGGASEEVLVNLPIAIKQFLCLADDSFPILSTSIWAGQLVASLLSLPYQFLDETKRTVRHFALHVRTLSRAVSLLDSCQILPRFYPGNSSTLLSCLGEHIVRVVLGAVTDFKSDTHLSGFNAKQSVPSPSEVEAGGTLLNFAVNVLGIPIVESSDSSPCSVLDVLFRDSCSSLSSKLVDVQHKHDRAAPKIIQVYGKILVGLILHSPNDIASSRDIKTDDRQSLPKVIQFLVDRLENTEPSLQGRPSVNVEHSSVKILLRKVLLGVAERAEVMSPHVVLNLLASMASMVKDRSDFLSVEQKRILLHVESLLPTSMRVKYLVSSENNTLGPFAECGRAISSFREGILKSVLDAFNAVASPPASEQSNMVVQQIVEAFSLLPFLMPGGCLCSCPYPVIGLSIQTAAGVDTATVESNYRRIAGQVEAALEEVLAAKFPLTSTTLETTSQQGKDYARIFRAWLNSFGTSGCLDLLKPLQSSLREGSSHIYHSWIKGTIQQFVQDIDYGMERGISTVALRVCQQALAVVFDPYQDLKVKFFYLDDICLPILLRCSSTSLQAMLCGADGFNALSNGTGESCFIKQLMDLITKHMSLIPSLSSGTCILDSDAISATLLQICCCFSIIETIYDRCTVEDLKGTVTQAFVGGGVSKGTELTQAICRSAHKLIRQSYFPRGGSSTGQLPEHQHLVQRAHSSAFNSLLIVVAKTQSEEKFFDNFLFIEKSSTPDQVFWSNVIDSNIFYSFEDCDDKFSTKYLGGYFMREIEGNVVTEDEEKNEEVGGQMRKRKLSGVVGHSQAVLQDSSYLLAESSLKRTRVESGCNGGSDTRAGLASQSELLFSQSQNLLSSMISDNAMDSFAAFSQQVVPEYHVASSQGGFVDGGKMDVEGQIASSQVGNPIKGLDDYTIALELNHLNNQFCMGMMLRVIQRMHVLFADKWLQEGATVPYWITVCKNKLSDYSPLPSRDSTRDVLGDTSNDRRNIRLFFLRLLMNQPVAEIVKPFFPGELLLPVLRSCLHDLCGLHEGTNRGSGTFHYMLRDIVFTLIDSGWTFGTSPCQGLGDGDDMFANMKAGNDERVKCSMLGLREAKCAFLSHLLGCVCPLGQSNWNDTIVKENVNSICILIKTWVSGRNDDRGVSSGLDLSPIIALISTSDAAPTGGAHAKATSAGSINVKRRLYGYRLLQTLVSAGYPLLDHDIGSRDNQMWGAEILQQVCNGCKFPRKEVSENCASVGGAILQAMGSHTLSSLIPEFRDFAGNLERKLVSLLGLKNGYDTVAICIRAICKHYPAFLTRELLLKMIGGFGKLKSRTKVDFLDVLCVSTRPTEKNVFEGISVIQSMMPYIPALLGDVSTVAFGHGSKLQNIPMLQLLTLRLIKVHCKDSIRLNLLPLLVLGPRSFDENIDQATANRGGSIGLEKALSEDSLLVVRQEAYEMLMTLHTELMTQLEDQDGILPELSDQIALARVMLLRGLTDPDDRGMVQRSFSSADGLPPAGIRRQVFDFFQQHCGFSMCPIERLVTLLTELFDPVQNLATRTSSDAKSAASFAYRGFKVTEQWLRYSSYLLLGTNNATLGDGSNDIDFPLFSKGLAPDDSYSVMSVNSKNRFGEVAGFSSTPMFSFENTQSQLASLSQGSTISSQLMSQYFPTQPESQSQAGGVALTKHKRPRRPISSESGGLRGMLKGTQQFSWSQTQQQNDDGRVIAAVNNSGRSGINLGNTDKRVSTQERFFYTQYVGDSSPRGVGANGGGGEGGVPSSSTFQVSLSQQGASQNAMSAPVGLPSRFGQSQFQASQDPSMLTVVTQRVPIRHQINKAGGAGDVISGVQSSSSNSSMYRKASTRDQRRKRQLQEQSRQSARVTMYRRFRVGELPDICISIMDLLGPLQQICLRDAHVAATLFDDMFQQLYDIASTKKDPGTSSSDEAIDGKIFQALHIAVSGTDVSNIGAGNKSSTVLSNTVLVNSLLSALRYCTMQHLNVGSPPDVIPGAATCLNVEAIVNTAIASLNYHNGIYLLEHYILLLNRSSANSEVIYLATIQLGRLYDALDEKDVLTGMLFQISRSNESRHALDVEISGGDYAEAIRLYNKLLIAAAECESDNDGGDMIASTQEIDMWTERSLGCIGNLLDWEQLYDKVETLSDKADAVVNSNVTARHFVTKLLENGSTHPTGSNNSLLQLLPHYTKSIAKLGGYVVSPLRFSASCYGHEGLSDSSKGGVISKEMWDETNDFLRQALQPPSIGGEVNMAIFQHTKEFLESRHPADLAMCFISLGQWSRAQAYVGMSYEQFISSWSSLNPSAVTARNSLLSSLQRVLEIEDTISLLAPSVSNCRGGKKIDIDEGSAMYNQLNTVLRRWQHSQPLGTDTLHVWDDLTRVRSLCLTQHILRQADLAIHSSQSQSSISAGVSCTQRFALAAIASADHLSNLHVEVAITAISHNVLQVGKEQLGVAGTYRKSINNIEHQQLGKKKVKGLSNTMSLNEVITVYAFNQRGIESAIEGSWSADLNGIDSESLRAIVTPRFENTMALLTTKQKLCEDACFGDVGSSTLSSLVNSNLLELLRVKLMSAEWSAAWGSFLQLHGGMRAVNDYKEKNMRARDIYQDVASCTSSNSAKQGVEFLKFSGKSHGMLAKHCDDMLVYSGESGEESRSLALVAINSYISGMSLGDEMSRARVLRLLALSGEYLIRDAGPASIPTTSRSKRNTEIHDKEKGQSITETATDTQSLLRRMRCVPAWMYLRFAAQIMGCVDRPEGPFAVAILEHIAETYPRALYYPFKVSFPSFSSEGKSRVNVRLTGMLKDDLSDVFVQALTGLTHPELRWTDGLKNIITLLELKKVAEAETALDELRETCTELEWPGVGDKIGEYNAKYARFRSKHGKRTTKGKKTDSYDKRASASLSSSSDPATVSLLASLSATFDVQSIRSLLKKAQLQEEEWSMKLKSGKVPLSQFSQWLSEFGSLTLTLSSLQYAAGSVSLSEGDTDYQYSSIEVPGQYADAVERDLPPIPDQHSLILAIDPQLLVMASIRKPKRMGLIGSGGDVVHFLVKGGEDLRNDQRVEELFVLMNRIIRDEALSARERGDGKQHGALQQGRDLLRARTFCVVPMTPRVGLLEWVKNTVPLKAVITSEMQRDEHFVSQNANFITRNGEGELQFLRASEERSSWLKNSSYHKMFKSAKNEQAEKLYRKLSNLVPDYFLRRRFVRMSPNAEAFLTLRTECAKSLAVSNLFGYILGLGDRHLDNLLLDEKTGCIVQIDFGICFGMGTSVLGVPELLPFRLTRQLTGLFRPLDSKKLLRHYMIGVLRPLRAQSGCQVLSNALEVYVNDPVVDWLKGPLDKDSMHDCNGEESASSYEALRDSVKWEPRRRIANAVRKTKGVHPVDLLVEDLELNNSVRAEKSLNALTAILWHSVDRSVSAKVPDSGGGRGGIVDCATQVDLLLDVATDPSVLVRQWVGLLPWV